MPSYDVLVTQDITQSTTIRVEADDPDQAAEKALSKARAKGCELDWTLSDGPCSDPYLGDDEGDVQLIDEPCPVNRRPQSTCPDGCDHGA